MSLLLPRVPILQPSVSNIRIYVINEENWKCLLHACEKRDVHDTYLVLTYACIRNNIIEVMQWVKDRDPCMLVRETSKLSSDVDGEGWAIA